MRRLAALAGRKLIELGPKSDVSLANGCSELCPNVLRIFHVFLGKGKVRWPRAVAYFSA